MVMTEQVLDLVKFAAEQKGDAWNFYNVVVAAAIGLVYGGQKLTQNRTFRYVLAAVFVLVAISNARSLYLYSEILERGVAVLQGDPALGGVLHGVSVGSPRGIVEFHVALDLLVLGIILLPELGVIRSRRRSPP